VSTRFFITLEKQGESCPDWEAHAMNDVVVFEGVATDQAGARWHMGDGCILNVKLRKVCRAHPDETLNHDGSCPQCCSNGAWLCG